MLSHSVEETEQYGEELSHMLRPGDTVWLYGGLGAGKTAFIRGLARGLGITDRVTSPTYTVAREYTGRLPLLHADLYRLSGQEELYGIGWDEGSRGVRAAEWAERMEGDVDGICVLLSITGDCGREITICYLP